LRRVFMPGESHEAEKLAVLLGYWIEHNREHIAENRAWMEKAEKAGLREVANHLEKAVELSMEANHHMEHAREGVGDALAEDARARPTNRQGARASGSSVHPAGSHGEHRQVHRHIELHQIGTIRTPYRDRVPPGVREEEGKEDFSVVVNEEFREGLEKLGSFSHIYVLFYQDRPQVPSDRPNQIGLSVVRVLGVSGNVVRTSAIDALDETPLLDIKPCFGSSDSKPDAGEWRLGEAHSAV
jgi:tRNA (Thr-GGU) A37 N-methylase